MTYPPLIAFGHQSNVGKDTAAELLQASLASVHRFAFADLLKDACFTLFFMHGLGPGPIYNTPRGRELRNVPLRNVDKTPVQLWVEVGQALRGVWPNVWVDAALASLQLAHEVQPIGLAVCTDLRFPNEAAAVRARGGWCVRVTRPGQEVVHGSDNEFPADFRWDAELVNDGDLAQLRERAVDVVRRYRAQRGEA